MTTASTNKPTVSFPWLETFLRELLSLSPYERPIAIFDCDGTVIKGDIGEAMLFHQLEHFLFRVSPSEVWPDHPDRGALNTLFETARHVSPQERSSHPAFQAFAEAVISRYFNQLAEGKTAKACADIVSLLSGYSLSEVRAMADETLRNELSAPVGHRHLGGRSLAKGIRYIRETVSILKQLQSVGFDIWVVSGSNKWSVESVFRPFGVSLEKVIGIELLEETEILMPTIKTPVPVLGGKVQILEQLLPRRPDIVLSDSLKYDSSLFGYSANLKVHVLSGSASHTPPASDVNDGWVGLDTITLLSIEEAWQM